MISKLSERIKFFNTADHAIAQLTVHEQPDNRSTNFQENQISCK